jgi:hypothetical protein
VYSFVFYINKNALTARQPCRYIGVVSVVVVVVARVVLPFPVSYCYCQHEYFLYKRMCYAGDPPFGATFFVPWNEKVIFLTFSLFSPWYQKVRI